MKPSLAFKGEDRATQGNWIDVYGGNGYCLPTITPHLPADVFVQMERAGSCVWDGKGMRSLHVTARNPDTGEIYDTRNVAKFEGGVYLTYEVTGCVRFFVDKTGGANAVSSGVFVDDVKETGVGR